MKHLLAKSLASTALVLVTFTTAYADNHNQSQSPFPTASEENPRWISPAQMRYFEQREAAIAKEVKDSKSQSSHRMRSTGAQESAIEWLQHQSQLTG